ncbi:sulfatase family protein [Halomarina oriensis]|uniref:Sulfatase-like hydrolase/transferase n=1 Tax=Halomarina oriensis TaxID=671145 RepID=A0A6B0GGA7_9EURY|nr:sulfatase-like hydrolase/transferase [Halomarina oriensis]MWG33852.1 sulfatase-like hydrolase/transferase [Halomarina oriensis]
MRVLYVDVDSLRPDHLGCYGYDRDTSPTVDRLASEGHRFTNYYASDVPCLPSRTALFGGRLGYHTGVDNHGGRVADRRRTGQRRGFRYPDDLVSWPSALGEAGLHTVSISPFPHRHDAWHVLEGVDEYYNTGKNGHELGSEVAAVAEEWLSTHAAEDDWFCHVNFWDPHAPYNVPKSYDAPFTTDASLEWLTEERLADQREQYGPHNALDPHGVGHDWGGTHDVPRMPDEIETLADAERWVDGYDVGVRYMDDHLGELLDVLEDAGVYEETLVVVSADHGENLGELNVYGDHQTADEHTCRLPLILRGPGVEQGVDDGLRYHVDLAPTVTELVGGDVPDGWNGASFADSLTGREATGDGEETESEAGTGRDFLVLTQGAWAAQRGVRWNDWLLLRTYHDGYKEALDGTMLFDLAADPHETTDLSDERPEVVEAGLARLQRWTEHHAQRATGRDETQSPKDVIDPLWELLAEGEPFHVRGRAAAYAAHLREQGHPALADRVERDVHRPDP